MAGRPKSRRVLLTIPERAVFDRMVAMLQPSWYGGLTVTVKDCQTFTEVRTWDKNGRVFNIALDTAIRRMLKGVDVMNIYDRLGSEGLVIWRDLVLNNLGLVKAYYGR